jgi:thioredoxin reductase
MENFDVIILGGGAAGLAAATALGRFRRTVAVIDSGQPRNAPASGVHNLLTRDGINPFELQRLGRAEAEGYGVQFFDEEVTSVRPGFVVVGSEERTAQRLLLATGVTDTLPDIAGLPERWGRDVIHCPYCHGWEVRDRRIGILGTHAMVAHQALLFRELSDDVTVYLDPAVSLPESDRDMLAARDIHLVHGTVSSVQTVDDALATLTLADGSTHAVDALAVASRLTPRADMVAALGLTPVEHPRGIGTHIAVDATGLTSVAGVWAAGNVSDPMAQVVTSAAQGLMAGAAINGDLVMAAARS